MELADRIAERTPLYPASTLQRQSLQAARRSSGMDTGLAVDEATGQTKAGRSGAGM